MKGNSILMSWLGGILFLGGVLTGLVLSASATWGPVEANLYTSLTADSRFTVKCPLLISPKESAVVRAKINNFTNEVVMPVVFAEISQANGPRRLNQTVTLAPKESTTLEWKVNASDLVFDRLILVNILQARYRDNPSFLGSCGIMLFSLFGLGGTLTFSLLAFLSLAGMVSGGTLWWRARQPRDAFATALARINSFLMGITILALVSAFMRAWGFTLFFDALTLLVMGIIFTDFVLSGRHRST